MGETTRLTRVESSGAFETKYVEVEAIVVVAVVGDGGRLLIPPLLALCVAGIVVAKSTVSVGVAGAAPLSTDPDTAGKVGSAVWPPSRRALATREAAAEAEAEKGRRGDVALLPPPPPAPNWAEGPWRWASATVSAFWRRMAASADSASPAS